MRSSTNKNEGRVQEISEITQGLKALAKELSVPVLALSQLSRAVEQRDDKQPQLADLRESGSIEQEMSGPVRSLVSVKCFSIIVAPNATAAKDMVGPIEWSEKPIWALGNSLANCAKLPRAISAGGQG